MGDGYGGSSGGSAVQNQNVQPIPAFGPQSIQSLKGAAQGGQMQEGPGLVAQALAPGQSPVNPALGSGGLAAGGSAGILRGALQRMRSDYGSVGGSGALVGGAASQPGGIGGALL